MKDMRYAPFAYNPGTMVKLRHCWGIYMLPEGLEEGALAKVVDFDSGYYEVEDPAGKRWTVSITNVEPVTETSERN